MAIIRELPAEVLAEIVKGHTLPFNLVRIDFPSTGSVYLSTGKVVTYMGQTWVEGAVRVNTLNWTPDGELNGTLALLNEQSAATALVLNNRIAESRVRIYDTYDLGTTDFTEPVLQVDGVIDVSSIGASESMLTILATRSKFELTPSRFHSQDNGFNWLPRAGASILWGGEKYVLDPEDA